MKRFFIPLVALFVIFSSCKKEIVEKTEVTEVINPSIGIKYSIKSTDWATQDGGYSFSASMSVPELDNDIYDHGAVLTYISFGTDYYEALPEVFDGIAYGAIHSESYVTVDFHALDGSLLGPPAGNTSIKIILIPTNIAKLNPDLFNKSLKEIESTLLGNKGYKSIY